MEQNKTEITKEMTLSEKEQHCMARVIQFGLLGDNSHCLYCRYAFECDREFADTKQILFHQLLKKLGKSAGIEIFTDEEGASRSILAGSWIEKRPELWKEFTGMSFEEQIRRLRDPDILKYFEK